jgi:hypothetical protein
MSVEVLLIGAIVGVATGWLLRRWLAAWRRRKDGGCAGGCGCADKLKPKS